MSLHVCVHICLHTHSFEHTHTYTSTHTHTYTLTHSLSLTHGLSHSHSHWFNSHTIVRKHPQMIYTHTHTHTHTHAHTRTHNSFTGKTYQELFQYLVSKRFSTLAHAPTLTYTHDRYCFNISCQKACHSCPPIHAHVHGCVANVLLMCC
jgi:hypothetical protein